MISKLAELIKDFPGESNQTQCFLHILNLVVKSVIHQFDLPNKQADGILDKAKAELCKLVGNIELEEMTWEQECSTDDDDDSAEGWVDEHREMTEMEVEELDKSVGLLCLMLTKVSDCYIS